MAKTTLRPVKSTYLGLLFTTMATLMDEILLTRIFSVTMWYHFAFIAISIALFGLTVGGTLVYLKSKYFTPARTPQHLSLYSLLFAFTIPVSFLIQLKIPTLTSNFFFMMLIIYLLTSVPFVFSGIAVSLVLTKYSSRVSQLYAADLIGAALGCLALIFTLNLTDGPTAVFAVAFLAAVGAVCFSLAGHPRLKPLALLLTGGLLVFSIFHTYLARHQSPLIRLQYAKGSFEPRPLYEKWNVFSRLKVYPDQVKPDQPFGWGLSNTFHAPPDQYHLRLDIDKAALTVLPKFDGDLQKVSYLKYDVTNLAHYLRPHSKVLIIGSGGGRDILSALVFDQPQITGVEINPDINRIAYQTFGDFTGHLDQDPRVTIITDEARSFIARQTGTYDLIQLSLIDTWAASSAGAYTLTENSLYTVEAWVNFLSHLSDNGVLTVSRWHYTSHPAELYRLTSLARQALNQINIWDVNRHLVIISKIQSTTPDGQILNGVGNLIVSKKPFTQEDFATLDQLTTDLDFRFTLDPRQPQDSTFNQLINTRHLDNFYQSSPINLQAPVDDQPFFFNMLKISQAFNFQLMDQGMNSINIQAISTLTSLLVIVISLTVAFIIVPLKLAHQSINLHRQAPLVLFFAAIGLAYLLIEVSQMQRLTVFLGPPVYSLSVVLFTLLLASGIGSFFTQKINIGHRHIIHWSFFILISLLVLTGYFTWPLIHHLQSLSTPIRILISVFMLFPLGFFMGMPFPLGIKLASQESPDLTPWLWGINGATSVCASVLAVAIAISAGISYAFWVGTGFYLLAALTYQKMLK